MFLLAWVFLVVALVSLRVGLGDEDLTFLYLAMAASLATVVLVVVQLRRSPIRAASADVVVSSSDPSTYHVRTCARIGDGERETIPRSRARDRGLAPCEVCRPG